MISLHPLPAPPIFRPLLHYPHCLVCVTLAPEPQTLPPLGQSPNNDLLSPMIRLLSSPQLSSFSLVFGTASNEKQRFTTIVRRRHPFSPPLAHCSVGGLSPFPLTLKAKAMENEPRQLYFYPRNPI